MIQTNFASRLKALYARLRSVENVRGIQGSLKKWSESLNKCEKSGKKAKYAVFCGSDQAARKCFERGRYMTVLNLFHFHEFSDLILLKT